ncbi:hypothetical protein WJX82_011125 [Trebouxia sp. C0006]
MASSAAGSPAPIKKPRKPSTVWGGPLEHPAIGVALIEAELAAYADGQGITKDAATAWLRSTEAFKNRKSRDYNIQKTFHKFGTVTLAGARVNKVVADKSGNKTDCVRACEEVFELMLGADAELVRINAQQLKPRKGSALASEGALEITLHPKDGPASGYIIPSHVAANLAFVWKQGFYAHNCQTGIYNWLYHSLRPQEDQSLHLEGKEPVVHRLITAIDLCNWKPGKALSKGMQACFAASTSDQGPHDQCTLANEGQDNPGSSLGPSARPHQPRQQSTSANLTRQALGGLARGRLSQPSSTPSGAEAASVGQPSLRAAAVRNTAVERPFARDPLRVAPPAPRQPVDGRRQSVTAPASRKRKHPEAADPPDGADMSRWRDVKKLCQKAIQHDLSDPEGVDAFSDAAREVVEAFGVNYDDCFGEVYTRHGAPAFFPRIKIIMEELAGMPDTTMGSYWPKINRLTQYVVRKRIVTEAERDAHAAANEEHPRSHGPELEQPYDQIINSTDYLELINAIEHGHVSLRLTAQEIAESRTAGSDVYLDANGLEEAVEELTFKGSNEFIHKPLGNSNMKQWGSAAGYKGTVENKRKHNSLVDAARDAPETRDPKKICMMAEYFGGGHSVKEQTAGMRTAAMFFFQMQTMSHGEAPRNQRKCHRLNYTVDPGPAFSVRTDLACCVGSSDTVG